MVLEGMDGDGPRNGGCGPLTAAAGIAGFCQSGSYLPACIEAGQCPPNPL